MSGSVSFHLQNNIRGMFFFQPPIAHSKCQTCRRWLVWAVGECTSLPLYGLSLPSLTRHFLLSCSQVNMALSTDSPAKCELRSVIRFLQAERNSASEIHRRMRCFEIHCDRSWDLGSMWHSRNETPVTTRDAHKFSKQTFNNRKVMATVFWDQKGVFLMEFMQRGTTITADSYCETLRRLRRAIQNKRRGISNLWRHHFIKRELQSLFWDMTNASIVKVIM